MYDGKSFWGGTFNNQLNRLSVITNCITKCLLNLSIFTSTTIIYVYMYSSNVCEKSEIYS